MTHDGKTTQNVLEQAEVSPPGRLASRFFITSGVYALACAPLILLLEAFDLSQGLLHITQLLATLICAPSAAAFLWCARRSAFGWRKGLAILALVVSAAWIGFWCYVIATFDLSGM